MPFPNEFVPVHCAKANIANVRCALRVSRTVLLYGPQGAGKTHTIFACATECGHPSAHVLPALLDETSDSADLIGGLVCTETPGELAWEDGPMLRAMRAGRWLLLEDVDMLSQDVLTTLARLRDGSRSFYVSGLGDIPIHTDFRVIGTTSTNASETAEEPKTQGLFDSFSKATKSGIGVVQWMRVPLHPPSIADMHEIVTALYGDVFDNFVIQDFLITPFVRFAPVIRNIDNRHISMRDMLKICRRLRAAAEIPSKAQQARHVSGAMRQSILFHFTDVLLASLADEQRRLAVGRDLCEFFGCGAAVIEAYLATELPALAFCADEGVVQVGRAAHSASQKFIEKRTVQRDTSLPFAPVRHTMRILERILNCVRFREPVVLTGDTGIGKTHAVSVLADMCCPTRLVVVNLSQNTEYADFIGGWKPRNRMHAFAALFQRFSEKFEQSFDVQKNAAFLQVLRQSYARITTSGSLDRGDQRKFLKVVSTGCATALQNLKSMSAESRTEWEKIDEKAQQLRSSLDGSANPLSFEYREGVLRECQRKGYWLLLDEVNLAPSAVLDRISAALESDDADPRFHLFACMNPTGAGKKGLPASLQTRFTTVFVDEPRERDDLQLLAKFYLDSAVEAPPCAELVDFFENVRAQAAGGALTNITDGTAENPHYSVRSFCRALSFCARYTRKIGFARALKDGLLMTFATQLAPGHQDLLEKDIERIIFKKNVPLASVPVDYSKEIEKFLSVDNDTTSDRFKVGHFAIPVGSAPPKPMADFVVTPSVYLNLRNIMRCVIARKPILLQGPTSAGKTSMVEYLARRSGHEFIRINNHKCIEIADYFGQYVQAADGSITYADGPLVVAARTGAWVVLDELNLAPSDVLEALNRLLDDNRELFVPETQERIVPAPQFHIFATQNPPKWAGSATYGGRFTLSKAFLNRFMQIRVGDIPADEVSQMLSSPAFALPASFVSRILKVKAELELIRSRSNILDGKMSYITPRDLFRWAKRRPASLQALAGHGLFLFGEKCRNEADRVAVQRALAKHCGFSTRAANASEAGGFTAQSGFETVCYDLSAWEELQPYLEKLSEVLKKYALVLTDRVKRLLVFVGLCLVHNEPALLVGETGTGKTTVCQIWSEVLGRPLFVVNCHQHTETSDLIGSFYPVRENSDSIENSEKLFEWRDGPVTAAMRNGHLVLLDEVNLAEENVVERLNSVLDHSRSLTLTEKGGALADRVVSAHPDFRIMATMNPGGDFGKKELSAALRNRFSESYVAWRPTRDELYQVVSLRLERNFCTGEARLANIPEITAAVIDVFWQQSANVSMRDILAFVDFFCKACAPLPGAISTAMIAEILKQGQILLNLHADGSDGHRLREHARQHYVWDTLPQIPSPLAKFDEFLSKTNDQSLSNYFIHANATKRNLSSVLRAMVLDEKPILLEGTAGMGKTSLVSLLSVLYTGKPVVRINLSEQSDWMDLIGTFIPWNEPSADPGAASPKTTFRWNDGILLSAVREGRWVVLDELNLAPQSVLEGLNSLFDHRRSLFLPEFNEYVHAGPGFRIFACQNPTSDGGGRKGLPRSLLNRFLLIAVEPFDMEDLEKIVSHTIENASSQQSSSAALPEAFVRGVLAGITAFTQKRESGNGYARGSAFEINLRDTVRWVQLTLAEWDALTDRGHTTSTPHMLHIVYCTIVQRLRAREEQVDLMQTLAASLADQMDDTRDSAQSLMDTFLAAASPGRWQALDERTLLANGIPFTLPGLSENLSEISEERIRLLPSQSAALTAICLAAHHGVQPVILSGASGVGKSTLIYAAGALFRKKVLSLHLSAGADTIDLLGGFQQSTAADGGDKRLFQWKDSLLVQAIEAGDWLVLEDANFIPCSVLDRLNPLCEPDGVLVLNEQGRLPDGSLRVVHPHPEFRLFFTLNSAYGELSKAMRNRGLELHIFGFDDSVHSLRSVAPRRSLPVNDCSSAISLISMLNALNPTMPAAKVEKLVRFHLAKYGDTQSLVSLFRAARSWDGANADQFACAMKLLYPNNDLDQSLLGMNENLLEVPLCYFGSTPIDASQLSHLAQWPQTPEALNQQRIHFSMLRRDASGPSFTDTLQAIFDRGESRNSRLKTAEKCFGAEYRQLQEVAWAEFDRSGYHGVLSYLLRKRFTMQADVLPELEGLQHFFEKAAHKIQSETFDTFENCVRFFSALATAAQTAAGTRASALERVALLGYLLRTGVQARVFESDSQQALTACAQYFLRGADLEQLTVKDIVQRKTVQAVLGHALPKKSAIDTVFAVSVIRKSTHIEGVQPIQEMDTVSTALRSIASDNEEIPTAIARLIQSPAFIDATNTNGLRYVQEVLASYSAAFESNAFPTGAIGECVTAMELSQQPNIVDLEVTAAKVLATKLFGENFILIAMETAPNSPEQRLIDAAGLWAFLGAALCHAAAPASPIHPELEKRLLADMFAGKRAFWATELEALEQGAQCFSPGYESHTLENIVLERLDKCPDIPYSAEEIDAVTYSDFFVLVRAFIASIISENSLQSLFQALQHPQANADETIAAIERVCGAASGMQRQLLSEKWSAYPSAALLSLGIALLTHGLMLWKFTVYSSALPRPSRIFVSALSVPSGNSQLSAKDFSAFMPYVDGKISAIEHGDGYSSQNIEMLYKTLQFSMEKASMPRHEPEVFHALLQRLSVLHRVCYRTDADCGTRKGLTVTFYGEGSDRIEEISTEEDTQKHAETYAAMTNTWDIDTESSEVLTNRRLREMQAAQLIESLDTYENYAAQHMKRILSKLISSVGDAALTLESKPIFDCDTIAQALQLNLFDFAQANGLVEASDMRSMLAKLSQVMGAKRKALEMASSQVEVEQIGEQCDVYRESFLTALQGIEECIITPLRTIASERIETDPSNEYYLLLSKQLTVLRESHPHTTPFITLVSRMEAIFKSVHEISTAYNNTELCALLPEVAACCLRWRQAELSSYVGKLSAMRAEMERSSVYERWLPFRSMVRSLIDESTSLDEAHAAKRMAFFAAADKGFQHAGIVELASIVKILEAIGTELLSEGLCQINPNETAARSEIRNWLLNKAAQYAIFVPKAEEAIRAKAKQIAAMVRDFRTTMKWTDKSFHHTMGCIAKSQAFLGRVFHMYAEALMQPVCGLPVEHEALLENDTVMRKSADFDILHERLLKIREKVTATAQKLSGEAPNAEKRQALDELRDVLLNARLGAQSLPDTLRRWLPAATTKDLSLLYAGAPHPILSGIVLQGTATALNQRYHTQLMLLGQLRAIPGASLEAGCCASLYQSAEKLAQTATRNRHVLELCCILRKKHELRASNPRLLRDFAESASIIIEAMTDLQHFADFEGWAVLGTQALVEAFGAELQALATAHPINESLARHVAALRAIAAQADALQEKLAQEDKKSHCAHSLERYLIHLQQILQARTLALETSERDGSTPADSSRLLKTLLAIQSEGRETPQQRKRLHADSADAPHQPMYLHEMPKAIYTSILSLCPATAAIRSEISLETVDNLLHDFAHVHGLELEIATALSALIRSAAQQNLQQDEAAGEGSPDEMQEGTGMGEGQGKRDVTDKLTSEDQLMDARDTENGPDGDERENENESDGEDKKADVTVTTDFQGNVEDQSDDGAGNEDDASVVSDNEDGKGGEDEQLHEADQEGGDAPIDEEGDGDPRGDAPDISTNAQIDEKPEGDREDADASQRTFEADEAQGEPQEGADEAEDVEMSGAETAQEEEQGGSPEDAMSVDEEDAAGQPEDGEAPLTDGNASDDGDGVAQSGDESSEASEAEETDATREDHTKANEADDTQKDANSAGNAGEATDVNQSEDNTGTQQNKQHLPGPGDAFTSFMPDTNHESGNQQHTASGEAAENAQAAEFAESIMDFDPSCSAEPADASGAQSFMMQQQNSGAGVFRSGLSRSAPQPGAQQPENAAGGPQADGNATANEMLEDQNFVDSSEVFSGEVDNATDATLPKNEIENSLKEISPIDAQWADVQARTAPLAHVLCENLRTILEPTVSDRLRGDYKTGKRLNIKKLIPYIASNFQKDRIWLRRTMPSKRSYQVALAVDDSYSMAVNSVSMACVECVSLLLTALHNLEAGELAVLALGSTMRVCHGFDDAFDCHAVGRKCLEALTFQQRRSNFQEFLGKSLNYLDEHRARAGARSSSQDVMQLMFIVSDGQITEDWRAIQALTTRANENNQLIVFLLLDAAGASADTSGKRSQSVVDMERIEISDKGKVVRTPYLADFPFSFYVVVQDIASTPEVVAEVVKQWIHASVSSG